MGDQMKKLIILTIIFIFIFSIQTFAGVGYVENITNKKEAIIYVGDSRAENLANLKPKYRKNYIIIYSNGGTLECINPNGGPRYIGNYLRAILNKYPKAPVVFALGINGNTSPKKNIKRTKYYDYYMKNYPSHEYIFSTLGGTAFKSGSYSNIRVMKYNKLLAEKYWKNEFIYIYDAYMYLKDMELIEPGKSKKGTRDGLHYQAYVSKFLLKNIRLFTEEFVL